MTKGTQPNISTSVWRSLLLYAHYGAQTYFWVYFSILY